MKKSIVLLFCLVVDLFSPTYAADNNEPYIIIGNTDTGMTSELVDTPISFSNPSLSRADIGMKYFGQQSSSDISVVLTLHGAKDHYLEDQTVGARFFVDDIPLSENKYRLISSVKTEGNKNIINTHLRLDELIFLTTGNKVKIKIYSIVNDETAQMHDLFLLTPTNFEKFKNFVKTIIIIKNQPIDQNASNSLIYR